MTNVNYVNPNGMDPRGEWVPQHFLAGWNYQDRLNDYNTARNLSNESSRLQNMKLDAENKDFAQAADYRLMQRQNQMMKWQNEEQINPLVQGNAMIDANATLDAAPIRAATLIAQQTNMLDAEKRKKAAADTLILSNLSKAFQGIPGADPKIAWGMVLQQAQKNNVDISQYKDIDPAQGLQFFGLLDENAFKATMDILKQDKKITGDYTQSEMEQGHADYRAGLQSGRQSAAGQREANLQAWTDKFVTLREKDLLHRQNPNKNPPLSAREQAEMEAAQIRVRDAFYQQGAAIQKEAAGTSNSLGILSGEEPSVPTTAPARSTAQTKPKDGKQWNVDNGDDYDSIPSGTTYMMDGQLWNKK